MHPAIVALVVVLWLWIALAGRKRPAAPPAPPNPPPAPERRGGVGWEVLFLIILGVLYLLNLPATPPA
jgi:hypothetical protein